MKYGILICLLLTGNYLFAQVIPVGFMKLSNPTNNQLLYLDATKTASYAGTGSTWTDISGLSPANSATLTNGPTFSLTNNVGSFTFTGNQYALTSKLISSSLSNATFIAWVNPSIIHNIYSGIIVSRNGYASATGTVIGLDFKSNNNSIGYTWGGNIYSWISNVQVPINEWSMVALTITSSKAIVYLCKSSGITTAETSTTHTATSGSLKFYVGVDPQDTSNRSFKGKISTAMVYSTALTEVNITAIFNAQKASFGL
jgi:hypothetical protein